MMRYAWMVVAFTALSAIAQAQSPLPPGTLLPVSLGKGIKINSAHQGQEIQARVMQDIPGTSIHRGAHVAGHVVDVETPQNGPARLSIRFDTVQERGRSIPIQSNLRALASAGARSLLREQHLKSFRFILAVGWSGPKEPHSEE